MMTISTRQPIDISKPTPVFLDYNKVVIKWRYKDVNYAKVHFMRLKKAELSGQ